MTPIAIPVVSSIDMVVEVACLGMVCVGLWWWALPRLVRDCLAFIRPASIGRRFETRQLAVQWADLERPALA